MREIGKENNAGASATGGLRDYDKHSVVSNTMQKVSFVPCFCTSLGCGVSGLLYFEGPCKRTPLVYGVASGLSFVNL